MQPGSSGLFDLENEIENPCGKFYCLSKSLESKEMS